MILNKFFRKKKPLNLDNSSEYGSHFIPLTYAALNSSGPILEMGTGHYSTPLLHVICMTQNRQLLSVDTSKEWLKNFDNLKNSLHNFLYLPVYEDDWSVNPKPELWDSIKDNTKWGVVFIDHRPGERRKIDIQRFKDSAEFIVVHDTQQASYGYEEVLNSFKFRLDYKRFETWTTIVSDLKSLNLYDF